MTTTTSTEKKVWIPEITDERLNELAARIKPVYDFGPSRGKRYVKPSSKNYLRGIAYTWEPKAGDKAKRLKAVRDITTYHSYGYYMFFKPSVAEVLAQIPDDLIDQVVAFEIIESPESADDLNKEQEALNAGYHVAKTRLYVRE